MSILRAVGIGFLAVLLTVNLVVANAAVATERTALNPTFVKNSLEEEGAYEAGQAMIVDAASEQVSSVGLIDELPISVEDAVTRVVTPEYLQTQVESNVDSTLAFLHGNAENPELVVDLVPIKEGVGTVVEDTIEDMTMSELIGLLGEQSGSDLEVSAQGVTLNVSVIGEMAESESAYREAREEFRADIRERVIDEIANETYETRSNDKLLALVIDGYDPDDYSESEKEAMVEDREDEIKSELEDEIVEKRGARIDREIDQQLSEITDTLESETANAVGGDGEMAGNATITEPAVDMLLVGVRGLTTDMTYEEYRDGIEQSKSDLAENTSAFVVASMSEQVPDRLDLMAEADPSARDSLDRAQRAVILFDYASIGLTLLALVMIGLLYLVSRSYVATSFASGASLLVAGIVGFIAAGQVPKLVENALQSPGPAELDPAIDVVLGILDRVFGTLGAQSLALAALGVVGIALGVYLRSYGPIGSGGEEGPSEDVAQ